MSNEFDFAFTLKDSRTHTHAGVLFVDGETWSSKKGHPLTLREVEKLEKRQVGKRARWPHGAAAPEKAKEEPK